MLGKLLKYEWKAMVKPIGLVSLIALISSALCCAMLYGVYYRPVSVFIGGGIPQSLILITTVLALAVFMIAPTYLLLHRFYKHHFTDEGYLTFTLPATTHEHLLASLTNILLWGLATGLVLVLCLVLILIPAYQLNADIGFDIQIVENTIDSATFYPDIVLGNLLIQPIYSAVLGLTAVAITCTAFRNHKFIYAVGVYYVMNLILDQILTAFSTASSGVSMAWLPLILRLILAVGGYFLTHYLIEKNLNI